MEGKRRKELRKLREQAGVLGEGEMDWYLIQCNSDDKWGLLFLRNTESSRGDAWCSSAIKVCGEVAFADN